MPGCPALPSAGKRTSRSLGRVLACVLVLFFASALSAGAQSPKVPRIEWADLPPAIVAPAPDLRTGYLVVPERRFPVIGRRTVRLPFILMKSRAAAPRPDPVLVTAGGPGGSTLGRARNRARNPLLDDRDVILFEQRGTQYAEPALVFPDIDASLRSGWGTRLNGNPDPKAVRKALAAALRTLKARGVDLAGYTTKESAADLADLRRLLGIPAWNLYGMSYSTKLMLTVLRDHPEGVRAVLLDSVLPPEANWDEEAPANILAALDAVLAAAGEDPALAQLCAELRPRFLRLVAAANAHPINVRIAHPVDRTPLTIRLDGAGLMNCVYTALESAGAIRRLPLTLDAACRGDVQVLAPLLEEYLGSSQGNAIGTRLSVWCNEEFPFERPARMLHPAGLPPELRAFVQTAVPPEALQAWPRGRPAAAENQPVASEVPILIAAGEFDPDTPVRWARRAAATLPNAFLLEFAGMSHVPLFTHPDAPRIMKAFLAEPRRRPDPGGTGTRPGFQPPEGPAR